MSSLAALLLCGIALTSAITFYPPLPSRIFTRTLIVTTTPVLNPPSGCYYGGAWYDNGDTIYRGSDGVCEYGAICKDNTAIHWDGYYCFHTDPTTTTKPTPQLDLTGSCPYGERVYFNKQIISKHTPWPGCTMIIYCKSGEITFREDRSCFTPGTTPMSTRPTN